MNIKNKKLKKEKEREKEKNEKRRRVKIDREKEEDRSRIKKYFYSSFLKIKKRVKNLQRKTGLRHKIQTMKTFRFQAVKSVRTTKKERN